ncbi:MAG: hypothetical protein JWO76_1204 [Nocardioides sp.]|nr:hypothetical protein [Nocardioides sp.]
MPEPRVEPGEPNPGGVDAITGEMQVPVVADLPPELNPAVDDDAVPDELTEGEDTSTQATEGEEPVSAEKESPV